MNTEISKLIAIGINHKTSTVVEREKYQINRKEIKHALNNINSMVNVEGTVILSTCNRLEFYLVIKPDADPFLIINDFYCRYKNIKPSINKKLFYLYNGIETIIICLILIFDIWRKCSHNIRKKCTQKYKEEKWKILALKNSEIILAEF